MVIQMSFRNDVRALIMNNHIKGRSGKQRCKWWIWIFPRYMQLYEEVARVFCHVVGAIVAPQLMESICNDNFPAARNCLIPLIVADNNSKQNPVLKVCEVNFR